MEGRGGPAVGLVLSACALLACLLPCAAGNYLRFEPGFEYQYKYHSKAKIHQVDTFSMEARVGYTCVRQLPEGQEIKLQVIAMTLQSGKGQGAAGHAWDFSRWFSFVLTPRGEVVHVKHASGEDAEALAVKKGLAALLAARLHHHTDQDDVKIVKTGAGWRYDVQELGHEGQHNATYHVTQGEKGPVFTKTRHNHPLSHAVGSYTKTIYYHDELQTVHTVEIKEYFDAMAQPSAEYDPYIRGHPKPVEPDDEMPGLPSMTGEGQGKLQFLTKIHVADSASLLPPSVAMTTATIHIDKVKKKQGPCVIVSDVRGNIIGNLTCMRLQPESGGSRVLQECFHALVGVLGQLCDDDLTDLVHEYFALDVGLKHYKKDRQHMVDAVWSVNSDHAMDEITRSVLLGVAPQPAYVERLLFLIGGRDGLPSKFVLDTLVAMTLQPERQKAIFQTGDFRHRLVLLSGMLIRHLDDAGHTERASDLANRLHDLLGVHDPHQYRQRRSTLTEAQQMDDDLRRVVLLEALGNGGLRASYQHIVSHVNDSNSQWVKRAGVHALRDYHHEHAANVILMAALFDEHETVRYESVKEYRRHPLARRVYHPDDVISNSSIFLDPAAIDVTAVSRRHHRNRRDLFEDYLLLLQTPSEDWQKIIGSKNIGASFGLTIKNMLDIKIGLQSGHGKVDIHDEAFGQVNLGFMGFNVDILRIRLCFRGSAEYNLNLFQEFDPTAIERTVKLWDTLKAETVEAVSSGVKLFQDILNSDVNMADILKAFGDTIKALPDKIVVVVEKVYKTLDKLSQYDDKELPPFIVPLKNLILKVANLIHDIQSDIMGFYNKLMTATVVIPYSGKQVFESVNDVVDSLGNFQKDPKGAVTSVVGGTLTIGVQVKAMADAVIDVKEAAFFLKKEKPYWWDLRGQARILLNMSQHAARAIREQGPKWVKDTATGVKDDIAVFTRSGISMAELKQKVLDDLLAMPEIVEALNPLENLGDDLQQAFSDLFKLVRDIRKAYVQLRDGARKAKQFIERVFGPKAHKSFPRKNRVPGEGCAGKGFYPSALNASARNTPEYLYPGVNLLLPKGDKVVAPFPGLIYLSGRANEVVIESRGGSPRGVLFVISNVQPNNTVKLKTDPYYNDNQVVGGQVIGTAAQSPCGKNNHVHLAMRKGEGAVDPTRYVEPRFPEFPKWVQECDDYKYVYKGKTQAAGSIAGLAGRKRNDTSPARSQAPAGSNATRVPEAKNPSALLDRDVQNTDTIARSVRDNRAVAQRTANDSNDSSLKTLMNSAATYLKKFNVKDMKMGSMVRMLHALNFQQSLGNLTSLFKTVQAIISNKPCVNPNMMPDADLRSELSKRGIPNNGSRPQLIKKLKTRSDKCPILDIGLPDELYCTMDEQCLGLECCLTLKVSLFKKVYKIWARFDPCQFALNLGIQDPTFNFNKTFGPDFGLNDIIGGFDETIKTGIRIDVLEAHLYARVVMEKEDTAVVLSLELKLCREDDEEECVTRVPVLDRALMPFPVCGPDGTLHIPDMDLKTLIKNQKDKFKTNVKTVLKETATQLVSKAFDIIPCLASEDDSDNLPCDRPDAMTDETLTQALESRDLDPSGTKAERRARLELDDKTCTVPISGHTLTLPTITNAKLAKAVYLKLAANCLHLEACVDIPIPLLNFSRSVRASMTLDACNPTFHVDFESCHHEILLFNNTMDFKQNFPLSDLFMLKTHIVKAAGAQDYSVDLGLTVSLDANQPPFLDLMFFTGFQVPVPGCSDFVLPGNGSLRDLASSMGNTLAASSVRFFMKALKLDTVLIEGSCDAVTLSSTECPLPIDYKRFLPSSFRDNVTCVMTPNCLGIRCCVSLDLHLPLMARPLEFHVPFHMTLDPCDNMKVDLSFGLYSKVEELLDYEFGQTKVISIGKGQFEGESAPVEITYAVNHYRTVDPYDEGFLVDLNVKICIPFDGLTICLPGDQGSDVMKAQKIPVCTPAAYTTLSNFNLTRFLADAQVPQSVRTLPRSMTQVLLNEFGISPSLKASRCDPLRGMYNPSVKGWNNECNASTRLLPDLPGNVVCHLSEACNRVDCCFYSQFLDLTFDAWFELSCDLYLQAGMERLVSPKLYILGGEVDWVQGISGSVDISQVLKLNYKLRKDDANFLVDASLQLCLGEVCQLDVSIMAGTQIPQPGCNPAALAYYNDLFRWKTCSLPKGDTGCSLSLPALLKDKCLQTDDCHGIQCCLPVDLGFLGTYDVHVGFRFDRCADSLVYSVEKKAGTVGLSGIVGVKQTEQIGSAVTFTYTVESAPGGFTLQVGLELCALDPDTHEVTACFSYDVLPAPVSIYSPASQCSSGRRRKRAVETPKYNCDDSPLSKNELLLHLIEQEATMEELQACVAAFKRRDDSKCSRLSATPDAPATVMTPKGMLAGLGDKNPSSLLFCNQQSLISVNVEGQSLIQSMLSEGAAIRGRLAQTYVPGAGLTSAGLKALSLKVANMTLGELQAYIMAEGIDPQLALKLMKDMRDLVYSLYSDVISKISNGGAEDLFESFDLTINGDFSLPRTSTNFFEYSQFFLVGGLVPMTFKFEAGITTSTKVLVGAQIMKMKVSGQIVPYVGLRVVGTLSVGALLLGQLRLTGYICQVALPSTAEIAFSKFPMDLNLRMDLQLSPLEIRLDALVTLEINLIFETLTKTLFKVKLFGYKAPTISKRVLDVGKNEPDNTPPQFQSFEQDPVSRRRRALATDRCFVKQSEGLDYTEPAIEIAVAANDDKSQPLLAVHVGSKPGLKDLLAEEMGGASTIITTRLSQTGLPVFFTVIATNDAGAASEVTCSIPTYDVTLPAGRLEAGFASTSNRHVLHGSLVVHEDSALVSSDLSVGLGKGAHASGVRAWEPVNLMDNTGEAYNANADPRGRTALEKHFTDFKEGRLVTPQRLVTETTSTVDAARCAKKCLGYPAVKCKSFNYHSDSTCQLLEAIEGNDHGVAVATNYLHFERLGAGLAHEFHLDVPMAHNELYVLNLFLQNSLHYVNFISSEGTLLDLTTPHPGPINKTSDRYETIPCSDNIPADRREDWLRWCRGQDLALPNHRIMVDGLGSATLFNGHDRLVDLRYTKANTYVSANWDGIHDYESGILGYTLTVGREVCEEWLHPHHDPHKHLVPIDDDNQWTHIGVVNTPVDTSLPDGKYYVTVRALNEVEYGGPLSTTICHSTPYAVDTSPPAVHEVFGTKYQEDTHLITTSFNASDPHSDIHETSICLGRSVLNCDLMPWAVANTSDLEQGPATLTFTIPDGVPAWVRLMAQNGVELQAVGHASHPIIVDVSPPLEGTVYDGSLAKHDLQYSKDELQYCANWFNFSDPESGIAYYMGAVLGDGGQQLTNLTRLDRRSHAACLQFSDPPLRHNASYSFLLVALNAGHRQLNVSSVSDGVLIDLTAPETGDVIDGLRPDFADVSFSVHKATVAAQWRHFRDPESDVVQYEIQIQRAENMTGSFKVIHPWENVQLSATYDNHHFQLNHRDVVKTQIRATNGATNSAVAESDSFLVDTTPPDLVSLWDGLGAADAQYQTDVTQLDASFVFVDEESGVDRYKYQVFKTQGGQRVQVEPATRNVWVDLPVGARSSVTVSGLSLAPGVKYSLRLAAVNFAGAVATYDTNGVLVDPTPPAVDFVHVGVVSSAEEEVTLDGFVLQSDLSGIKAAWLATDHESGVHSYHVAVGTTPGATDVLDWRDVGRENDGYIGGLNLQQTDTTSGTPVYYVSVQATNGAGATGPLLASRAVKVLDQDQAGIVADGGVDTVVMATVGASASDLDYQADLWSVTAQFSGFTSHLHGLRAFDWAVGTSPGGEDLLPFTALGLVHDERQTSTPGNGVASRGLAQTVLPLQPSVKYYTTVRAFNNDGQATQSSSDGFSVVTVGPVINLISLSQETRAESLAPGAVVYQREADALTAEWNVTDAGGSAVRGVRYALGTYPAARDVIPLSPAPVGGNGVGALPSSSSTVTLNSQGRPNILTLWADNSVGIESRMVSPSVVVDVTGPEAGVVTCPLFIQAHSQVVCTWTGFSDAESPVTSFTFFVGSAPGLSDVIAPMTLGAHVSSHPAVFSHLTHNSRPYVTVTAANAVGLTASATSDPVAIDTSPPVAGIVVELSDRYTIIVVSDNNDTATVAANGYTCDTEEACLGMDAVCQEAMSSLLVAWSAFQDPETSIAKYEVAVGTTPGGGQVRTLEPVAAGRRYHRLQGLDLMGLLQVYVTVKATNGAGASTTATSNGVYLSYLSQGLTPPGPVQVWDRDSSGGDVDYQTSTQEISARWTVEGDGCPAVRYQWAVERADGRRLFDFYDTKGVTFGLNDGLSLSNLETYYQLVRVTNALGFTYTLRSDGVTVHQDPLIPGEIYDGNQPGFDLNYLPSSTKVSANWQSFGKKAVISGVSSGVIMSVAVEALKGEEVNNQKVVRYEVALGTDRRYDNTRDNVVAWTDVGLNTSVTFYDLTLTQLHAIYYFSVRAYSASNSKAEVTSNGFQCGFDSGVTGGRIDVGDYINTNDSMELSWDSFQSQVGMFIYYVSVSSAPVDNISCPSFTGDGGVTGAERLGLFDIVDMRNVGGQTFVFLQNVSMTHNSDVFVHVIGVDRAGLCRRVSKTVHVDVTPPVAGRVKGGPYYNTSISFAPNPKTVTADWDMFLDLESPISTYTVELLMQPACDVNAPPGGDVISSFVIDANYSSYTFLLSDTGLSLSPSVPYYIRVTADNMAALVSMSVTSAPIMFDDSLPVGGHVVDGGDFLHDEAWVGSNSTVTASILHLATPSGSPCPARGLVFTSDSSSAWTPVNGASSRDLSGRTLDLVTQPDKVRYLNATSATVTLTRGTNHRQMYTGTLLHPADFARGGTYEMDIEAADGDGNAVTSVTLLGGAGADLVHYDFTRVVETEFCLCCLDVAPTTNCSSVCSGCSDYVAAYLNNTATSRRRRRRRSTGVQSLTSEEMAKLRSGMSLEDVNAAAAITRMPACGLQLYTLNSSDPQHAEGYLGRLVTWCMFGENVLYEPKFVARPLTFDPSAGPHHYKLHFYEVSDEAVTPTSCFSVYLDGDSVEFTSVCGIPQFNGTAQLAFTVWNWKNFLTSEASNDVTKKADVTATAADVTGTTSNFTETAATTTTPTQIDLWQASATFSNILIPAPATLPCRYGNAFRGGRNPIVRYEAGVGSGSGLDDVSSFKEVYTPCFPCVHPCDSYTCDPTCDPNVTLPVTLTLRDLDLRMATNANSSGSEEYEPVLYFFTVKVVLGSGRSAVVSSDGFSVDVTAPVADRSDFYYLDDAQGEAKPVVSLMASNSTIRVLYRCSDNESDIVEYQFAIGTTPGGQDIQNFTSTGKNPTGKNDQLLGVISHNTRYYVTYRCRNGGGLVTTVQDPTGILAFIQPLAVNDVVSDLENVSPIGSNVLPKTARQSADGTSVTLSLTLSADPSVDEYYFSIGSKSSSRTDDIFPRAMVAHNISGVISIRDGNVYKDDVLMFALSASRAGYNGTADAQATTSDFQMEPGREMFAFVDSCNEAACSGPQLVGSVLVVGANTHTAVSASGEALRVGLTGGGRTQRSADSDSEEDVDMRSKRATSDQVFVETPSGLQPGQAIAVTPLDQTDLSAPYDSVASTGFVSYLADPAFTLSSIDSVERLLAGRSSYSAATGVAFSVAAVGQLEMPGPLRISFPYDPTDAANTATLLHWNPEQQQWQLSSSTCHNEADTVQLNAAASSATVKVCDTYGSGGSSSSYFSQQTLFLVTSISNTVHNNPPTITSANTTTMLEDEGTLVYTVTTADPEMDNVTVALDSPALSPDEGSLVLTSSNRLLFTPCADCSGRYELRLLLTESPVTGVAPATASATVVVVVTPTNDPPTAFAFSNGSSLLGSDPAADVVVLLEQNHDDSVGSPATTYTWVFGAFDVDTASNLTLTVEGPSFGALTVGTEMTAVPPACAASVAMEDDTIPCLAMTLPQDAGSLAWRYLSLTYRPNNGYHGYDTVRLLATDEGGLGSFVTTLRFAVMQQPCENGGTCVSKSPADYTCQDGRRAAWFDGHFVCRCPTGHVGLHCSGDVDDCSGRPCSYPYVCVDLVNTHACRCSPDNPGCDGLEGWMVALIVLLVVVVVVVVGVVAVLWAFRTGRIKWKILEKLKLKWFTADGEMQVIDITDYDYENDNKGFQHDGELAATDDPQAVTVMNTSKTSQWLLRQAPVPLAILKKRSQLGSLPTPAPSFGAFSFSSPSPSPSSASSATSTLPSSGLSTPQSRRGSNVRPVTASEVGPVVSLTGGLHHGRSTPSPDHTVSAINGVDANCRLSQVSVHLKNGQTLTPDMHRRRRSSLVSIGTSSDCNSRPITPVENYLG